MNIAEMPRTWRSLLRYPALVHKEVQTVLDTIEDLLTPGLKGWTISLPSAEERISSFSRFVRQAEQLGLIKESEYDWICREVVGLIRNER